MAVTEAPVIDAALRGRLVARVVKDTGVDRAQAELDVDAAVGFLLRCATTEGPHTPDESEDRGWHAFLLHTREYAGWCERVAGRFLHHDPTDSDCSDCHSCNRNCNSCVHP